MKIPDESASIAEINANQCIYSLWKAEQVIGRRIKLVLDLIKLYEYL